MDELLDTTRAAHLLEELRAYHDRMQGQREETWIAHASKFPRLRVRLDNYLQSARENAQNTLEMSRAVREYGPTVAEHAGVSIPVQITRQLRLYAKHEVPPDSYYFLRMYQENAQKRARFFLSDAYTSTLLYFLSASAPDGTSEPLYDKQAFWAHCRQHGLPSVPILAVFEKGHVQHSLNGPLHRSLPPQDLFSKPVTASIGRGAQKWIYDGAENYMNMSGRIFTPDAVVDALKRQSREEAVILQPCVTDHPQLEEATGHEGPSTLRIITIRKVDASPEYFAALLTTPRTRAAAPTFKGQTALAARVADSGQLGRLLAKRKPYFPDGQTTHPATGKRMAGLELPHWDEAKSLALQAHASLQSAACVGWDLMITQEGPLLLEGNNDCSAALLQITHQKLLGRTRFPLYLQEYVRAQP